MGLKYVRKTGSDAADGLTPATAWLTLAKAGGATGAASGDEVWIGAGVYREGVTMGGTYTAETKFRADVDGAKTGDAGEVRWSGYGTDDKTAPAIATVLNLNGKNFLTFEGFTFHGGTGSIVSGTGSNNIKFTKCAFLPGNTPNAVMINYTATVDAAAAWTVEKCRFWKGSTHCLGITLPTSTVADYDVNFQIRNCKFLGGQGSALNISASGANSFKGGGVDVFHCVQMAAGSLLNVGANIATSIPCTVYNSYAATGSSTTLSANASGQITEDWNVLFAVTPRSNVTAGTNSKSDGSYANLLHIGQEAATLETRAWGAPTLDSPLLGFGGQAGGPSDDIDDLARPSGPGPTWGNASIACGAHERGDTGQKETTTVYGGSAALKITGPGCHDFTIPIDAVATTIKVRGRFNASYAGTKPQLEVLAAAELGVSLTTATMAVGADTWEQISVTVTPTAAGIVTVRLKSSSTAGAGIAYFDDFSFA